MRYLIAFLVVTVSILALGYSAAGIYFVEGGAVSEALVFATFLPASLMEHVIRLFVRQPSMWLELWVSAIFWGAAVTVLWRALAVIRPRQSA